MKPFRLLLLPLIFFVLLILTGGELLLMRKIVVFLCLPAGIVWVLLTFALFWPRLPALHRTFLGFIWIVYSLGGNALVGNKLLQPLEKPYANFANPDQPFDLLFVLGGGTGLTLNGDPQTGSAGDRVITSARLYLAGKTKKLVASGRSITEIGADRNLAAETISIWKDLGIPESDMVAIPKPRSTGEEIDAYKIYIDSLPDKPGRIGICTSAWHLKRAEKLWKRKGIDAIPVPSDFRSRPIPYMSTYLIPKKRGFAHVQLALWEYLGLMFD